ncbi:putative NAD(P)H nitroreductase YfhC [Cohnella abietis]|uniref:Putative NAD(P)H nitroreductase YfhC n=1 Tax=Cohnella abietis TaxID=2507935 RepID=A0A3T1D895_9BACL|nr:putative NAD(P)H nitroreductase YfhC [Cohnella abietis]
MDIADVIRDRRTIRQFSERQLTTDTILELLEVAKWAPTHGLREPWRFICAADEKAKEKLSDRIIGALEEFNRYKWLPGKIKEMYKKKLMQIPVILFVVVKEEKGKLKREEDFAASCALIQNLQLYGWEKGIGMIWSIEDTLCGNRTFCDSIGIQKDERIAGMLYMGYYDRVPKAKQRTSAERKMTWL